MDRLNVIACELTSIDDLQANEARIWELLQQIPNPSEVDLISFPENSLYMRLSEKDPLPGIRLGDPIFDRLSDFAQRHGLFIHLGSVPLAFQDRTQNATVLIDSNGIQSTPYQKIHLFDVDIAGHRSYRESDAVIAGTRPSIIDIKGWKIGLSICYDLRFSDLYSYYARQGVDLILIPSAFTVPTGEAHWETLVRARAIETQAYVVAAAQVGSHRGRRETYGHSMIVDPWGKILNVALPGNPMIQATLKREKLKAVRTQIPMDQHRRGPFSLE